MSDADHFPTPPHDPIPVVIYPPRNWRVMAPCSCGAEFNGEDFTRPRAENLAVFARREHIAECAPKKEAGK
jgi:hypothetical protein